MSSEKSDITSCYFEIIRDWYQFQMDEQPKPIHASLFLYIVEKFNSLWWPNEIGLPTDFTMRGTCIGSYNTYKKTLNELESFGFIIIVNRGKNQYTATRIALSFFDKAYDKARDKAKYKAMIKQVTEHVTKQLSDNKQLNNETTKLININSELEKQVLELREKNEALILEVEKKKAKPPKKSKKEFPPEIVDFTREMIAYLKPEYSEGMSENTFRSNCDTIDKLIRLDGETMENIRYVMNWISGDDFWSVTLQGINKLREKNKQGIMQMIALKARIKAEKNKPQPTNQGYQTANERRQQKSKEVGEQLMQQLIKNANGGK